jgi:NADPH-dependent curcumin reductase CurA
MAEMNRRILLAARPVGEPRPEDFRIEDVPVSEPGEGQVLVRVLWLSLDPYMRGRMSTARSYVKPVELGDVMVGEAVGEVVTSRAEGFAPGDLVRGFFGWQTHAVVEAAPLRRVDAAQAPIQASLGILGMPGMTAWTGMENIGKPRAGETVAVAAAAGPVGSLVGQIAK